MKTSTGGNRGNGERFFYKNSVVSVISCENDDEKKTQESPKKSQQERTEETQFV
jgi:hypothetical protein